LRKWLEKELLLGNVHVDKGRALTAGDVTNIFNDGTADYSSP